MLKRGDQVLVGLCDYTHNPQRWVPGTVVAVSGPTIAVVLWTNANNGQRDWIGPSVYVKPNA